MNHLLFHKLNNPKLLARAASFPLTGYLQKSVDNLIYLDIDDAFVHELLPLLPIKHIVKPDYFGENLIGAHISVIYPEEGIIFSNKDLEQEHHFTLRGVYTATLGVKDYYVLCIESPTLRALRQQYGLPDQLNFKQHWVDFHITIGVVV